jgi:hypothetical protein
VLLWRADTQDAQDVLRVHRTDDQLLPTSTCSPSPTSRRERLVIGYSWTSEPSSGVMTLRVLVGLLDRDAAGGLGDGATTLGRAGLEELLDTGQTLRDVVGADATPPVWNVRIVSCVPGSPIDWAAMMPTASPMSTSLPVASERP